MKNHLKTKVAYNPWFYSIGAIVLTFTLSLTIVAAQSIHSYNESVEEKLDLAVQIIDNKIDDKNIVFEHIYSFFDEPCRRQNMVDIKMRFNQFQTINIVKNNKVTCSNNPRMLSYRRTYHVPNNTLHAAASHRINKGDFVYYINELHDGDGIIATMSGQDVYSTLNYIASSNQNFRLITPESEIDKHGKEFQESPTKHFYTKTAYSKHYGYNIKENIILDEYIDNILDHYLVIIIFFSFISLIIGKYVHINVNKKSTLFFMKSGIKNKEFIPFAQPIMDTAGNLSGCEILMRWKNKQLGFIYPDQFIPQAEQSGLIIPMTGLLLETTYDLFKSCEDRIPNDFHIGVNISSQHFEPKNQGHMIDSCKKFSSDSLAEKAHLTLELTERNSLENYDEAKLVFDELQKMNIKMAIDDFGTGHSTLTYIQKLSFDFIKIDKSFIDFIGTDAISAPLVDNIIDLSQRLNLSIVAEGVETQEQLDYLRSKKVDLIQGYYYSKPIPLEEFIEKYFG